MVIKFPKQNVFVFQNTEKETFSDLNSIPNAVLKTYRLQTIIISNDDYRLLENKCLIT